MTNYTCNDNYICNDKDRPWLNNKIKILIEKKHDLFKK